MEEGFKKKKGTIFPGAQPEIPTETLIARGNKPRKEKRTETSGFDLWILCKERRSDGKRSDVIIPAAPVGRLRSMQATAHAAQIARHVCRFCFRAPDSGVLSLRAV